MLSGLAMGLAFTSCQKEDVNTEVETAAVELKEAPFTNYMVISGSNQLTKSTQNFLELNGDVVRSIPEIGVAVVSSNDLQFVKNTLKNKDILSVVPDYEVQWIPSNAAGEEVVLPKEEVQPESIGDLEPFYGYLWGMDAIEAPEAWNAGFTGKGASVFVLDSGIDAEHPDIAPNLNSSLSASFVPNEADWNIRPGRYFNHGTHVAGTIAAAQNQVGVIGVAPDAEIVAVKVLSEYSGSGPFSAINAGLVHAANNGADVVNMSLGISLSQNGFMVDADGNEYRNSPKAVAALINAQQRAIDYAVSKGVTVIASAGNDGNNYDGYGSFVKVPGGLNKVVGISATAPEGWNFDPSSYYDVPASYTDHGRSLVDLAAPGGDSDVSQIDMIVSAGSGGGYYFAQGTSMAAPHVAGVAALIIAKNGGPMSPIEVEKQLSRTADKIDGEGQSVFFGKGRVNAFRAVTE